MTHVSNPLIRTAKYTRATRVRCSNVIQIKTHLCKLKILNFFYLLIIRRFKKHNFKYSGNYFRVQALHKKLLNLKIIFCCQQEPCPQPTTDPLTNYLFLLFFCAIQVTYETPTKTLSNTTATLNQTA